MYISAFKKLLKGSFPFLRFFPLPECLVELGLSVETWIWSIAELFPVSVCAAFFNLEFPLILSLLHYFIFFL